MPILDNPIWETYCQLATTNSYVDAWRGSFGQGNRSVGTMHSDIWKFNARPVIAQRIREIQSEQAKSLKISREWILRWWFDRMTYDPTEITAWAIDCCRCCYGDGHQRQWTPNEFMDACAAAEATRSPLPDIAGGLDFDPRRDPVEGCPECHGRGRGRSDIADTRGLSPAGRAAFEGIKETRQGIEIKMADKGQAAEQFAKLSGMDVAQVRLLTDPIPDDVALDALARDPIAIAAAYKRFVNGMAMH